MNEMSRPQVTALLGPTNTGKTHYAIDRMMGHASGMIGFPLRLLARENYDRVVKLKGAMQVALVTGEEKIIPKTARYFICTVESMPLDRRVSFMAVDEIQLCADPDRGHIFTDRLLHARGMDETLFMGAETIKPLMRQLLRDVEFISRPRFSKLTYTGQKKLNRLPPRSAVVAFSAADVYAMAEFVRRQRGGAAVVLGALSPRTRNAQVGMYQAGEVDYIVATDAIGMGLNMDVDHVAFAGLRKFDGRAPRGLEATEIAQIAGRAGRHMNDGTFGTTGDCPAIDADVVEAVENHSFGPLRALMWRNSDLRFTSVQALLAGLERRPETPGLMRARDADDQMALEHLAQDADILKLANHPERVKLLWDVAQVPDFCKISGDSHTRFLNQLFKFLTGPGRKVPTDYLAKHLGQLDRLDGEMDTLLQRIAHVRTWTYISHRNDWIIDSVHWQNTARAIEDRLSDALHDRLTKRFVDKRTAHLVRKMRDADDLLSAVARTGDVLVEGHFVGRLNGFIFQPDGAENANAAKAVQNAAAKALKSEIASRVNGVLASTDDDFALSDDGFILWDDQPIARLVAGGAALTPLVEILPAEFLENQARERLKKRLTDFVDAALADAFGPLFILEERANTAQLRALAHALREGLGSCALKGQALAGLVQNMDQTARKFLNAHGIRVGVEGVFVQSLLKPGVMNLRSVLWQVFHDGQVPDFTLGGTHLDLPEKYDPDHLEAIGYRAFGPVAVRVDVLEPFAQMLRQGVRENPDGFALPGNAGAGLGLKKNKLAPVVQGLGWSLTDNMVRASKAPKPKRNRPNPKTGPKIQSDSPFVVLKGAFGSGQKKGPKAER